ncbi:MAG: hypothetical protein AB1445_00690 [Bacillota bacterium]
MERRNQDRRAPEATRNWEREDRERRRFEREFTRALAAEPELWQLTGGNPDQDLVETEGWRDHAGRNPFSPSEPDYELATAQVPGFEELGEVQEQAVLNPQAPYHPGRPQGRRPARPGGRQAQRRT